MKVLITAGFDRSLPTLALAELLRRNEFEITGLLIVKPWQPGRVRSKLRGLGLRDLLALSRKAGGRRSRGPLKLFLEKNGIMGQSLTEWAKRFGIPVLKVHDLNDDSSVKFARSHRPEWVVYGGGGILRQAFLDGEWRVANAHLGPLPQIRGMNAVEWSVLLGFDPSVTVHIIDEGIDTGAVIDTFPIDVEGIVTIGELREQAVCAGIDGMVRTLTALRTGATLETRAHHEIHRQCFSLSPAMKELLEERLKTLAARK